MVAGVSFEPIPLDEIPAIPAPRAAEIIFQILLTFMDQPNTNEAMTAWLHENRRTINLVRKHRPDLFDAFGQRVAARRTELGAAAA